MIETTPDYAGPEGTRGKGSIRPRRNVDLWVAVLGLLGVLAGTIVGALIAGGYSSSTTERQIAATMSETLRADRQSAYAEMVTNQNDLQEAFGGYGALLRTQPDYPFSFGKPTPAHVRPDPTEAAKLKATMEEADLKARQSVARIRLVGSANSARVAFELSISNSNELNCARLLQADIEKSGRDRESEELYRGNLELFEGGQSISSGWLDELLQVARSDLGVEEDKTLKVDNHTNVMSICQPS